MTKPDQRSPEDAKEIFLGTQEVDQVAEAARLFLRIVEERQRYVNRRVEDITFAREEEVIRKVRIDVSVPADGRIFPVSFRLKSSPGPVEAQDQARRLVPLLTPMKSAEVAFTALVIAGTEAGTAPSEEEENLLLEIVTTPAAEAAAAKDALFALQPKWRQRSLRALVDPLVDSLPVFACLEPASRQMVTLTYFPQPLSRARGGARLALKSLGGRTGVLVELFSWPPAMSRHVRVNAPPVAEIVKAEVLPAGGGEGAGEVISYRSGVHVMLGADAGEKSWLRMDLALRPALTASLVAAVIPVLVGLVIVGFSLFSGSVSGLATAGLLTLPAILALRVVSSLPASTGPLARVLLQVPVLLLVVAMMLGIGALAIGGGIGSILTLVAASGATLLSLSVAMGTLQAERDEAGDADGFPSSAALAARGTNGD